MSLALDASLPISDAEVRLFLFWMGDCLGTVAEPAKLDTDDDEDAESPLPF